MWDIFKDWIYNVIEWFWSICGDWGLAIILVTVIFRLLISPLMYKQQKSSYAMQKLQPEINRIKERFPDDPQRQQIETQKMYADSKFNPLIGCIPMLIQLPIFMALFQVLRELGDRIEDTSTYCFYNLIPNLVNTPADAFAMSIPDFIPYAILMLLFAVATFVPTWMASKDNPQNATMTKTMSIVMSVMMLWISWTSPAGVLLFWGASSVLAIAQQMLFKHMLKEKDRKEQEARVAEVKPVEVNVTRTVKKKRQHKSR